MLGEFFGSGYFRAYVKSLLANSAFSPFVSSRYRFARMLSSLNSGGGGDIHAIMY